MFTVDGLFLPEKGPPAITLLTEHPRAQSRYSGLAIGVDRSEGALRGFLQGKPLLANLLGPQ
jgi:hypothetical protein